LDIDCDQYIHQNSYFLIPFDLEAETLRGLYQPGVFNPKHSLPVTNLEKSRRLSLGGSLVWVQAGLGNFSVYLS